MTDAVVSGFLAGLSEKGRMSIEPWSLENILLPRSVSSMPGQRSPISYQQGFFEALEDPTVEVIVLMTSSQVGKSELLSTVSLYYMVEDPSRILFIQPKDDAANEFKSERLDPIIEESPTIRDHLAGYFKNKSMDQTGYMAFPGGHIDFKGANSPTNLAGKPMRILLMDEIDRYPGSIGGEGDPVTIAMARTKTERSRKIVLCSTPKDLNRSRIHALFKQTDQRRRFVTCEECDGEQTLKFDFDETRVQETKEHGVCYFCEVCGAQWTQSQLRRMEQRGEWKATAVGRKGWAGFHISELYSPFSSLEKILADWRAAKDDTAQEQAFVNTTLGEPFEGKLFQRTSLDSLKDRREDIDFNKLPPGCLAVTGSLDLQGDRAEVMHMGHGIGGEKWVLDITRIYGDPKSQGLWSRVTSQLNRRFVHESGNEMFVEAACLDAGFLTQTVVDYVTYAREQRMNVYAIVGRSGQGRPLWTATRSPGAPGKLWAIGIDEGKTGLMMSFAVKEPGPGYVHISRKIEDDMCEQFLAEQCEVSVNKFGAETRTWVNPKKRRNEALDLAVYAEAAFALLGLDLEQRMEMIYSEPVPKVDIAAIARQMKGER